MILSVAHDLANLFYGQLPFPEHANGVVIDHHLHFVYARLQKEHFAGRLLRSSGSALQKRAEGPVDVYFHGSGHGNNVIRENFKMNGVR